MKRSTIAQNQLCDDVMRRVNAVLTPLLGDEGGSLHCFRIQVLIDMGTEEDALMPAQIVGGCKNHIEQMVDILEDAEGAETIDLRTN